MTEKKLKCDNCLRRNRWMLRYPSTGRVICTRCVGADDAHEREFPDCQEGWHDGYDHDAGMVRRADA